MGLDGPRIAKDKLMPSVIVQDTEALFKWIEGHLDKPYFGVILIKIVDGGITHVEEQTSMNIAKWSGNKES